MSYYVGVSEVKDMNFVRNIRNEAVNDCIDTILVVDEFTDSNENKKYLTAFFEYAGVLADVTIISIEDTPEVALKTFSDELQSRSMSATL